MLPKLTVEARGDWLLKTEQLVRDETNEQGRFTLKVPDLLDMSDEPRSFRIRVLDVTKRPVTKDASSAALFRTMTLATSRYSALIEAKPCRRSA